MTAGQLSGTVTDASLKFNTVGGTSSASEDDVNEQKVASAAIPSMPACVDEPQSDGCNEGLIRIVFQGLSMSNITNSARDIKDLGDITQALARRFMKKSLAWGIEEGFVRTWVHSGQECANAESSQECLDNSVSVWVRVEVPRGRDIIGVEKEMRFALDRKSFVELVEANTRHVQCIRELLSAAVPHYITVQKPELKNDHAQLTDIKSRLQGDHLAFIGSYVVPLTLLLVITIIGWFNHWKVWQTAVVADFDKDGDPEIDVRAQGMWLLQGASLLFMIAQFIPLLTFAMKTENPMESAHFLVENPMWVSLVWALVYWCLACSATPFTASIYRSDVAMGSIPILRIRGVPYVIYSYIAALVKSTDLFRDLLIGCVIYLDDRVSGGSIHVWFWVVLIGGMLLQTGVMGVMGFRRGGIKEGLTLSSLVWQSVIPETLYKIAPEFAEMFIALTIVTEYLPQAILQIFAIKGDHFEPPNVAIAYLTIGLSIVSASHGLCTILAKRNESVTQQRCAILAARSSEDAFHPFTDEAFHPVYDEPSNAGPSGAAPSDPQQSTADVNVPSEGAEHGGASASASDIEQSQTRMAKSATWVTGTPDDESAVLRSGYRPSRTTLSPTLDTQDAGGPKKAKPYHGKRNLAVQRNTSSNI
jgi:hypothetical protein